MAAQTGNSANSGEINLKQNRTYQLGEIVLLFAAGLIIIWVGKSVVGTDPVLSQLTVWVANIVMIGIVWAGLKIRGQRWDHIGLQLQHSRMRSFIYSLLVFAGAMLAFGVGSAIMINFTGLPVQADFSNYQYLQGNLPMLLLGLAGVFIASSFGEEIIYRGFLITRIEEMGTTSKSWTYIAVLVSSVIFALIHVEWGPTGMVQTGFMGLALGASFLLLNRNLWILIWAHAYMDTILFIQLYLGN